MAFNSIYIVHTLEFQIEVEGGINEEAGKFRPQKSLKLINGEDEINGEVDKNTAIRNFIEIQSSNDLAKISTRRT